jgi:hypothetical protein
MLNAVRDGRRRALHLGRRALRLHVGAEVEVGLLLLGFGVVGDLRDAAESGSREGGVLRRGKRSGDESSREEEVSERSGRL